MLIFSDELRNSFELRVGQKQPAQLSAIAKDFRDVAKRIVSKRQQTQLLQVSEGAQVISRS